MQSRNLLRSLHQWFSTHRHTVTTLGKSLFWFCLGIVLGLFFFASTVFIWYKNSYKDVVYPGVYINGIDFGKKTQEEVRAYFAKRNNIIQQTTFVFQSPEETVSVSARDIGFGYDEELLATQAYTIGRSDDMLSNISLIFQAYVNGINLSPAYHYSEDKLMTYIKPLQEKIDVKPVDARFSFENGRVVEFRESKDGQALDIATLKERLEEKTLTVVTATKPQKITITIPIKIIQPEITTEKANNLGIKELLATGTSLFQGSIQNRVYNVTLASTRLNGILVAPGETFSFAKALGDVSSFTGYKQAYIISGGRTILGDGGGVCQVSTTFFRAVLNAGLPIVERHPHAYRVGYYEQDSGPGIDAAVYIPSVDFKFKNDTAHHILVQTVLDPNQYRLTFEIYGTKDGREVTVDKPVILSQTGAPAPLYQDDPNLPKGVIQQVDWAAPGASVYFTRTVKKDGKVIISDKFSSYYKPWQAVFLRGTRE